MAAALCMALFRRRRWQVGSHKIILLNLRWKSRLLATISRGLESKPFSAIPAETGWPVVGVLPEMWKSLNKPGESHFYQQLQKKHGNIYKMRMLSVGAANWGVCVSSPEGAEAMFRAEGKFPLRGIEETLMWIYKKNNIPYPMFFSGGEEWKRIRSGASRQVIPRRVGNYTPAMCELANDFVDHLVTVRKDDGTVHSIQDELQKFAFRGVSYFVFNEKLDVYGSNQQHQEFQELAIELIESLGVIALSVPIYKIYPTKHYKNFLQVTRAVHEKGREILKKRRDHIKDTIESGTVDDTKAVGMLDQWLVEGIFTDEEAIVLSSDMLAAGIDTTSNSSTFLLHELAKHPDVQEKLLLEIKTVLGEKTTATYEDLQKMSLVRNCVKETMRLYVPTTGTPRVCTEDVVILGYQVPAGSVIITSNYPMSRNNEYFQDPDSFIPERWKRGKSENVFASLPFGFGPRACYGRRLAELEMYTLISQLIPRFKLSTEQQSLKKVQATVLKPAEPVNIRFAERN